MLGIVFWGGFNTAMEWTNREEFCISCHEMKENVYVEYRNTIHYQNRTGVRATCPDCHVPKDWFAKIIRKIQASNEVLHKVLGSIDTPEKFNAKRATLAQHEWDRMKKSDSQECRNCHNYTYMDYAEQNRRSAARTRSRSTRGRPASTATRASRTRCRRSSSTSARPRWAPPSRHRRAMVRPTPRRRPR